MQEPDSDPTIADEKPQGRAIYSLIHGTDLWLTLIILTVCGGLYYVTSGFDEVPQILAQNITPEWFPRLLIWIIVILALLLPIEHLFHVRGKKHLDEDRRHHIKPMAVATAGLLTLVVASMQWLGTYLTMIFLCIALPMLWGERRLKVLLPFAIIFPTIVALLFTQVLKVYFEPGIFGLGLR